MSETVFKELKNIYVDGCCNKDTGNCGWGSVVDEYGENLLDSNLSLLLDLEIKKVKTPKGIQSVIISKFNDVASQQNNGAELLGMIAGLKIGIKYESNYIHCDSSLIVDYWSQNKIGVKTKNNMDPSKYKYIQECYKYRRVFEALGGKIIKISGYKNIADLGYHK